MGAVVHQGSWRDVDALPSPLAPMEPSLQQGFALVFNFKVPWVDLLPVWCDAAVHAAEGQHNPNESGARD